MKNKSKLNPKLLNKLSELKTHVSEIIRLPFFNSYYKVRFVFLFATVVFVINRADAQKRLDMPTQRNLDLSIQKSVDITIRLDSSINPKEVLYQYYNGKTLIFLPDTFGNKRVIRFKGEYYSPLASFNVIYQGAPPILYSNDFFVSDKPVAIDFYLKPNKENKLLYSSIENAHPIYDTAANEVWRKMKTFMTDPMMAKENAEFELFVKQNPNFSKKDSLKRIFNSFYKSHLNRAMLFLKKYPDDYFSFWYFRQQVAQVNGALGRDTAYLKKQLTYIKSVFPAKYTQSAEGKALVEGYEAIINPTRLNEAAPVFNVSALDGKSINLRKFRGKYVLLDFWATWCPPCMAEMPFIKELRKTYGADKLVIIGISLDINLTQLKATVKSNSLTWLQFYDKNKQISSRYGINLFPALVLIDKKGNIVYKSDYKTEDSEALPKVLNAANIKLEMVKRQ